MSGSKRAKGGGSRVCPRCNLTYSESSWPSVHSQPREPSVRRPSGDVGVERQSVGAYMRGDSGRIWGDRNLNRCLCLPSLLLLRTSPLLIPNHFLYQICSVCDGGVANWLFTEFITKAYSTRHLFPLVCSATAHRRNLPLTHL